MMIAILDAVHTQLKQETIETWTCSGVGPYPGATHGSGGESPEDEVET